MEEKPSDNSRAIEALDGLLGRLNKSATGRDVDGGWREETRDAVIKIILTAKDQIQRGVRCDAAFHFVRWMDHMGLVDGPLLQEISKVQCALPKDGRSD